MKYLDVFVKLIKNSIVVNKFGRHEHNKSTEDENATAKLGVCVLGAMVLGNE